MMNNRWFRCAAAGARRAEVTLFDDIGGFGITAQDFVAELDALGPLDALTVAINSGGGDVFEGLAIYNRLRALSAPVTVRIDGLAASIASIIAMAGEEIVMPESAWVMVHDPSALVAGGAEDMRRMAGTLDGIKGTLADIYVARTGLPKAEIEAMMAAETWMAGPEAVARGFATRLITTPAIAASLNFSKFHRVPEEVRRTFTPSAAKESLMPDTTTAPAADAQPDRKALVDALAGPVTAKAEKPAKPDKAEIEAAASRIADERVKAITAAYRAGRDLGLENECQRLIDDGIPASEVPEMLIQVFARRQQRNGAIGSLIPSGATVGFSNEDPKIILDRMAEGITSQFVPDAKVSDASSQYRGWRPQAFMRAALELRGTDTRRMQPAEIVNAAMTTSDFPNLLGTSANKIFLGAYEVAEGSYRAIAARRRPRS